MTIHQKVKLLAEIMDMIVAVEKLPKHWVARRDAEYRKIEEMLTLLESRTKKAA